MNRVHWTPNHFGGLLLIWSSLWLGGRYLLILKELDFIPDLIRVVIWAAAFFATPFLIWRLVEFTAEIIFAILQWKSKK